MKRFIKRNEMVGSEDEKFVPCLRGHETIFVEHFAALERRKLGN